MKKVVFVLIAPLLAGACTASTPNVVPESSPGRPASRAAAPPVLVRQANPADAVHDVPAMTSFSVSLVGPMGTRLSAPGDPFRAKVISPLRTLRGYTLVPVGSVLKGRVVAVEQAPASRLRLKFETLTTTQGPVALQATLTDDQPSPSFVVDRSRRAEGDYDVTLDGLPAVALGGSKAAAGRLHSDIRLVAKTQLQVMLVHPLRVAIH